MKAVLIIFGYSAAIQFGLMIVFYLVGADNRPAMMGAGLINMLICGLTGWLLPWSFVQWLIK